MRWIRCLCLGAVIALLFDACSRPLQLRLFNNTMDTVIIHLTTLHGFRKKELNIVVGSHLSAQFDYQSRTLSVSTGGCELIYPLPQNLHDYPFPRKSYNIPVQAQLNPDLAIYLLPPDVKSISDVGLFASLQLEGFPLRPNMRTCRQVLPST
jgi:hypothetical protein